MIYDVIVGREPEISEHLGVSYEDVLAVAVDHLMSGSQSPLTIRRRCCSSVHKQTMCTDTCNDIRELVKDEKDGAVIRKKLDLAVNNWYLKGKISLSDENIIGPFDCTE